MGVSELLYFWVSLKCRDLVSWVMRKGGLGFGMEMEMEIGRIATKRHKSHKKERDTWRGEN